MTTREKFIKLRNYMDRFYDLPKGEFNEVGKMRYYYVDESYFSFQYFGLDVTVMNGSVDVTLPNHIDFKDFNPSILLRDLWKEAVENLPSLNSDDMTSKDVSSYKEVTLEEVAYRFGVPVANLRIKE